MLSLLCCCCLVLYCALLNGGSGYLTEYPCLITSSLIKSDPEPLQFISQYPYFSKLRCTVSRCAQSDLFF
jgi:hypothetical protein